MTTWDLADADLLALALPADVADPDVLALAMGNRRFVRTEVSPALDLLDAQRARAMVERQPARTIPRPCGCCTWPSTAPNQTRTR